LRHGEFRRLQRCLPKGPQSFHTMTV
jgi:hypothetical protein